MTNKNPKKNNEDYTVCPDCGGKLIFTPDLKHCRCEDCKFGSVYFVLVPKAK
jgi:predicted  nucleic acid-binding Zn ribbon protein